MRDPGEGRAKAGGAPEKVSRGPVVVEGGQPLLPAVGTYTIPRVLLVTEGTYPFHFGGVSTWCDHLVRGLAEVPFAVLAISSQPGLTEMFDRPANVFDYQAVPLWGLKDPAESQRQAGALRLHRNRRGTTAAAVSAELLPPLRGFLEGLLASHCDGPRLADDIHRIYRFLREHDFDRAFRSRPVWELFTDAIQRGYAAERAAVDGPEPALWELTTAFQWMCRWLFPLARPLPEVEVAHAAMAGICTIVCVAAQREFGAGFLLTEHGVYLRERYIAESSRTDSHFLKYLSLRFSRRITELSYAQADQISPCCDYNQRWELRVGASPAQLQTIYYAVEDQLYRATDDRPATPSTVVWVGRINPLKDVETLLRAAAQVAHKRPDVRFLLYGSAPAEDADYYARCLALHAELGLEQVVTFRGYTSDPAAAYNSGDIVVLPSVSEGFPYSTLEAMLCGRPVVATSVGGIPEQIEGCGIIVEPRNPQAVAEALLALFNDPDRCVALGAAARHRASSLFGMGGFTTNHLDAYRGIAPLSRAAAGPADPVPDHGARHLKPVAAPAAADSAAELERLVGQVRARTTLPVDALEVAAILESAGMTDQKANDQYGFPDTFELAGCVYDRMRQNAARHAVVRQTDNAPSPPTAVRSHLDTARHPLLALLPPAALVSMLWVLTAVGRWSTDRVLAVGLGMTCGMLFTNGITIGMGPRASMLVSFGRIRTARRFLAGCVSLAVLCTVALAEAVLALHWGVLSFLNREPKTFVLAAAALSLVWCLAGALSLVALSGWTGTALSVGVLTAVGLDRAAAGVLPASATIGCVAGLAVTVGVLVQALDRGLRSRAGAASSHAPLPSIGYLLLEALPYYLYGTLGVVMIVSVHVVGWAAVQHGSTAWGQQISTLELGLFLPLVPAVLSAGQAEQALHRFWQRAAVLQQGTPVTEAAEFGRQLAIVYQQSLRRYLARLGTSSAVLFALVVAGLRLGPGTGPLARHAVVLLVLVASGLLGYGLLGWAQFNAMFGLSLLSWRGPLRAATVGTAVTAASAIGLIHLFGYPAAASSLIAGAGCYGLLARRHRRRLLADADYHYVMAV